MDITNDLLAQKLLDNDEAAWLDREEYKSGSETMTNGNEEVVQTADEVSVTFKKMQISVKTTRGKNATDKLYAMIFWAHFEIIDQAGKPITIQLRKLSLPIAITVHGSQHPKAWGTIFWMNAFQKRSNHIQGMHKVNFYENDEE